MIKHLCNFLKGRYESELPILLAFSGGPDSLALLHLLIEFSQNYPLNLALAHVDHSWRVESSAEAQEIILMAEKLKLPLHVKKLQPELLSGNLEAACREERLKFFAYLCQEHRYQAVLLAHHADDLSETVLKRVFEGAALPYLSSLRSETFLFGMKIWRPLLKISKNEILKWLEVKGLKGFNDDTNLNLKFLRGKFRVNLLPFLSEQFGKEISSGLCQVAQDAGELRDYLDERVNPYLKEIVTGKWGHMLDLSPHFPFHSFELKHLIRQFCKQCSYPLSRDCLVKVSEFIKNKTANKFFSAGKNESTSYLYIDRGRLFILFKKFSLIQSESILIKERRILKFNNWLVQITDSDNSAIQKPSNWLDIWKEGKAEVFLPRGEYRLTFSHFIGLSESNSLVKRWTNQKIPAFFRTQIPVILEQNIVRHEFLTGEIQRFNQEHEQNCLKLSISYEES